MHDGNNDQLVRTVLRNRLGDSGGADPAENVDGNF
jgi:hypothetical protein